MNALGERLGRRLGEQDAVQVLFGYLALSVAVIAVTWPRQPLEANDAWFSLVQIKAFAVALVSLAYGMSCAVRPQEEKRLVPLALFALFVLTLPLEGLAFIASVPPLPWWWAPLVQSLIVPAYFTFGLGAGWLLARLNLLVLAPVLALLLLIGAFFADLALGVVLFNPAAAASRISPAHLLFTTFLLGWYLVMILRRGRQ